MTHTQIRDLIRDFVVIELLSDDEDQTLTDDESLFRREVIDSLGILQLLAFVDREFDIRIESTDVTAENFDTIERLAEFVQRKLCDPAAIIAA